jgi:hypothetical protein
MTAVYDHFVKYVKHSHIDVTISDNYKQRKLLRNQKNTRSSRLSNCQMSYQTKLEVPIHGTKKADHSTFVLDELTMQVTTHNIHLQYSTMTYTQSPAIEVVGQVLHCSSVQQIGSHLRARENIPSAGGPDASDMAAIQAANTAVIGAKSPTFDGPRCWATNESVLGLSFRSDGEVYIRDTVSITKPLVWGESNIPSLLTVFNATSLASVKFRVDDPRQRRGAPKVLEWTIIYQMPGQSSISTRFSTAIQTKDTFSNKNVRYNNNRPGRATWGEILLDSKMHHSVRISSSQGT